MEEKNQSICTINSELAKACAMKMVKSRSNWVMLVLTYIIWCLVGLRYSTNQNFDMVIAQQNYVMYLSLASIIVALVNRQTSLVKLAMIGSVTFVISFVTVVLSKVGVTIFGYPIGYYLFCPVTLFLMLLQVKEIICFSRCK